MTRDEMASATSRAIRAWDKMEAARGVQVTSGAEDDAAKRLKAGTGTAQDLRVVATAAQRESDAKIKRAKQTPKGRR